MSQRLLPLLFLLLCSSACFASAVQLIDKQSLSLLDKQSIYMAEPIEVGDLPPSPPTLPSEFIKHLALAEQVDRINGGSYWLYKKFINQAEAEQWVVETSDSIIDSVHIYVYQAGKLQQYARGFLHEFEYPLSYAAGIKIEPKEDFELLIFIQSRYFTYNPQVRLLTKDAFESSSLIKRSIVIACLGAIFILALYNLLLGVWVKDKSNIYYSAYLLLSIFCWLSAFNLFSQWFTWHSYWLLISPFFLTVACNTLYIIHFLEVAESKPQWLKYFNGFVIAAVILSFCMPLFKMGQYMLIYGFMSTVWIVGAFICGLSRWREGYRPARFFVIAFAVLALGIVASSIPMFMADIELKDNYIFTLVAQTFDMLLLSLALADRINMMRDDKTLALEGLVSTERWATKKEKEANVKLQQALEISEYENQRRSDFLRMVSHELRTPLYSIISSIEQWRDVTDVQGQKDLLHYVSYGAARLRMQVDNLVLLAETDDHELQPINRPFEPRVLLESMSEHVRGLINPGVVFDYACEKDIPQVLIGDVYLFEHMLRTVLENACKYTEHGKIGFYASWVDEALSLEVIDTGCGMTREQERTMFNDFIQVSRGLERNSEGLGIGLTVCYRLSEVLGADLNIRSSLGVGTVVEINTHFELADESVRQSTNKAAVKPRVLIVEDNVVNGEILQSLVMLVGCEVCWVESGQEALTLLESQAFDLIFMDIQMPVMDGITATRWIRRRNLNMPIVAVTANSDTEVRSKCFQVGMNEFLVKPVRRADIQRVIDHYFDGQISE